MFKSLLLDTIYNNYNKINKIIEENPVIHFLIPNSTVFLIILTVVRTIQEELCTTF